MLSEAKHLSETSRTVARETLRFAQGDAHQKRARAVLPIVLLDVSSH
jgi:hypothetical protein